MEIEYLFWDKDKIIGRVPVTIDINNAPEAMFVVTQVTDERIYIEDKSYKYNTKMVIEDAEKVTGFLYEMYGNKRFILKDPDGFWHELVHNRGTFDYIGIVV